MGSDMKHFVVSESINNSSLSKLNENVSRQKFRFHSRFVILRSFSLSYAKKWKRNDFLKLTRNQTTELNRYVDYINIDTHHIRLVHVNVADLRTQYRIVLISLGRVRIVETIHLCNCACAVRCAVRSKNWLLCIIVRSGRWSIHGTWLNDLFTNNFLFFVSLCDYCYSLKVEIRRKMKNE